jgi:hypothetical protein
MHTKTKSFIARLLFVPVNGLFAFAFFAHLGKSLNDLIYNLTENNYLIFLRFDTRDTVIFWTAASWIAAHLIFETIQFLSSNFRYKKLLTNLRYAPVMILIISGFAVVSYDAGMIAYSRQQIRNYIYNDSQLVIEPDISLHNNYRSWCGNGFFAQENYLYFDTASEGINDENPFVRSRSLIMMSEVRDWINGGDKRFDDHLANSCRDPDALVRNTAEVLLNDSDSSCQRLLFGK